MIEKTVIPDAVFFDMDGLLLDSEVVSLQCFNELIAAHGLHDHESVFVSLIGTNEDAQQVILHNALGKLLNVEAFWRDWKSAYTRITSSRAIPLKQGAHALLGWLHEKGVPCVVATSTPTRDAHRMLDMAGVLTFLAGVVGGDQVSRSKPQPDIYLAAMALVNAEGPRPLGLVDSSNGVSLKFRYTLSAFLFQTNWLRLLACKRSAYKLMFLSKSKACCCLSLGVVKTSNVVDFESLLR